MEWPDGRTFAFTIFDDPDTQTEEQSRAVYGLLGDLGFRTTKGVWPIDCGHTRNSRGVTCATASFLRHCQELQAGGFEIGYHNAAPHDCLRAETLAGLERFREYFGADPATMANHYNQEAIYWGPERVSGARRLAYQAMTLGRTRGRFFGEVEGHPAFWGDLCRERIAYCRNFTFREIDTLAVCPSMPYTDPARPYVNAWYASTDGAQGPVFFRALSEANQDRLEERGGACIMYTHFGLGFFEGGKLNPALLTLMKRLSRKNGWFVPVRVLLDYLRSRCAGAASPAALRGLEWRWLRDKLFRGAS